MSKQVEYLREIGIDVWVDRNKLTDIKKQVTNCTLCSLHKTRTHVVFGVGNEHATVMFVGEAPGAKEDLQGEPFVGRAGVLLNEMLKVINLKRTDIYITNILKCRPPNNRDPSPQEVKFCTPYLQQQIYLIKPKLLVAVGRIAAQFLLNSTESMTCLRGNIFSYKIGGDQIPLIITYHPAYLLRAPTEKRKAYDDFLLIKEMIRNTR
ncbi:MAG: uracil-DNA glycosylase [Coxiellaceae bacterium]|nr:uracil-DNA glycosylase [Coxiellaceae bacterium]